MISLQKTYPRFTSLAPSEQGPCFSIAVFPEHSPVPAQTLNKFMFSGQSEKLEVTLIFLENRDLRADQGGWGRLVWKSEYELQRGGFIGGHI